jgi:hypothetical protein
MQRWFVTVRVQFSTQDEDVFENFLLAILLHRSEGLLVINLISAICARIVEIQITYFKGSLIE